MKRAIGIKRAEKLIKVASDSIGLTQGLTAAKMEMKTLLEQHELLTRQIEDIMSQVESLLEKIPGSAEMLSIPGVGITTLAGFLAETGDLSMDSKSSVWRVSTSERIVQARRRGSPR